MPPGVTLFWEMKAGRCGATSTRYQSDRVHCTLHAAAAYYLGYACYKMGEPSRRLNADKEKAKELFAKAFSLDPTFTPTWGR